MLFKPLARLWKQNILQVLGDQFYDLLTGELTIMN